MFFVLNSVACIMLNKTIICNRKFVQIQFARKLPHESSDDKSMAMNWRSAIASQAFVSKKPVGIAKCQPPCFVEWLTHLLLVLLRSLVFVVISFNDMKALLKWCRPVLLDLRLYIKKIINHNFCGDGLSTKQRIYSEEVVTDSTISQGQYSYR